MTIDASENIFLVGTTIGSLAQNNNGDNDTFLIKLNKSGIKQYRRVPRTDRGWGVATDSREQYSLPVIQKTHSMTI